MNKITTLVLIAFFVSLAIPVMAEPNNLSAANTVDTNQPKHIIVQRQQPKESAKHQLTDTELIIEKAHEYFGSELDRIIEVVAISVGILVIGFIFIQFIIEWQRNKNFKKELDELKIQFQTRVNSLQIESKNTLDEKETQLQKYFDIRLEEETEKLKEKADNQLKSIIWQLKSDLARIYLNLSFIYEYLSLKDENKTYLGFSGYLVLRTCSTQMDLELYDLAIQRLNKLKTILSKITEQSTLETISIPSISKQVEKTNNKNLKETFNQLHEAYIIRKHELEQKEQKDTKPNEQE